MEQGGRIGTGRQAGGGCLTMRWTLCRRMNRLLVDPAVDRMVWPSVEPLTGPARSTCGTC